MPEESVVTSADSSAEILQELEQIRTLLEKFDGLFSSPEELEEFVGYAHMLTSIYTVLVFILAILVIYGIFKLFSSLFSSI